MARTILSGARVAYHATTSPSSSCLLSSSVNFAICSETFAVESTLFLRFIHLALTSVSLNHHPAPSEEEEDEETERGREKERSIVDRKAMYTHTLSCVLTKAIASLVTAL